MKNTFLKPLALVTVGSFTLFGCASSSETAVSEMNMSQTSYAGGMALDENDNQLDVLVVEENVMIPVATLSTTALLMENTEEVKDMFENMGKTDSYSVWELAKKSPNLSTFVQLIERAELADDLERVEKLTLFAPTNEAFANMPKEQLEMLLRSDNTAALSRLLQAHVLSEEVSSVQLNNSTRIAVTENSHIPITRESQGDRVRVGRSQIVKSDIEGSNGRIHVVDRVILPTEDFRENRQ